MRFLGTVPLPALISEYRAADIVVLPSVWQESYGLPVAEVHGVRCAGARERERRRAGAHRRRSDGQARRRLDTQALVHALREMVA